MSETWRPSLPDSPDGGGRALYERLLAALADDIRSGALAPGSRLPPQRTLAYDLGISVGTVTKVYAEAERRGLVTAHVGRGSFVAAPEPSSGAQDFTSQSTDGVIDLGRNSPPVGPAQRRLADAMTSLRLRSDLALAAGYAPPGGLPACRAAAADWLRRRHGLADVHPDEVILTNGAQQAMSLALSVLCRSGDDVLCEAATYVGMKAIAEQRGVALRGVALDAEGLLPDALDRAAAATGARVLYTIPTLQNPTAAVMGAARRAEIVAVARARGLAIVEDDVYAVHVDAAVRPPLLRGLAPERTWLVASGSKSISPGLRAGFLVPPSADDREAVLRALRAQCYAVSALPALVATQWIEDGTADAIADEIVADTRARWALAREVLADAVSGAGIRTAWNIPSPHLWLPMSELAAERTARRALRAGVEVTSPSAPIVDPAKTSGLRICVGPPPDLAALERGLRAAAAALASDGREAERAVV